MSHPTSPTFSQHTSSDYINSSENRMNRMNLYRDTLQTIQRIHETTVGAIYRLMDSLDSNHENNLAPRETYRRENPPFTSHRSSTARTIHRPLDEQNIHRSFSRSRNQPQNIEPENNPFHTTRNNQPNLISFLENFFESIQVVPTPEQIQEATRVVRFSDIETPMNESCPISMEQFLPDSNVVEIIHCHHLFNPSSLQNWFQTSVRCPVCRHDIRTIPNTNRPRPQTQPQTQTQPQPQTQHQTQHQTQTQTQPQHQTQTSSVPRNRVFTFETIIENEPFIQDFLSNPQSLFSNQELYDVSMNILTYRF